MALLGYIILCQLYNINLEITVSITYIKAGLYSQWENHIKFIFNEIGRAENSKSRINDSRSQINNVNNYNANTVVLQSLLPK